MIVQRLDAEAVAGAEQPPPPLVPDREGPHAAEARQAGDIPLGVGGQQHLAVGLGAEGVAARRQLGAQFAEVVDLAVEDQRRAAVGAAHGLVAGRCEIEDRQPPEGQADRPAREPPGVVGAAVAQAVAHRREQPLVGRLSVKA